MTEIVKQKQKASTENKIDGIQAMFGRHPEDVIAPAKVASEVFDWLEAICKAIEKETEADTATSRFQVKRLAQAGAYLAHDFSSLSCSEHEEMREALKASGVEVAA